MFTELYRSVKEMSLVRWPNRKKWVLKYVFLKKYYKFKSYESPI